MEAPTQPLPRPQLVISLVLPPTVPMRYHLRDYSGISPSITMLAPYTFITNDERTPLTQSKRKVRYDTLTYLNTVMQCDA